MLVLSASLMKVQAQNNRFNDSEEGATHHRLGTSNSGAVNPLPADSPSGGPGDDDEIGPGNLEGEDPEPVPIDDYIPLLVLTALGILIYKAHRGRNLLS